MVQCLLSIYKVALGSDNIMINSEIWNKVVFVMVITVSLELLRSSSFGFSHTFWESIWVAGCNRLLLREFPVVTQSGFGILKVTLSCDNIMVKSKVWNKVVLIVFVHICLKFHWSSSFGFSDTFWECVWITGGDWLFLCKLIVEFVS